MIKLPRKLSDFKVNYLAMAFLMPFVAILVLMMFVEAIPFGDHSLLYSDCWHQYFPFFKAFRKALLSGESLLYSWDVGMGMDYLGLISYYLASPLNLLSVLLPESWVLPYFSFLMPIKLSLASLFFAIFLKKMFGKNDISIAIFGSFYGLCAWALGYQWNIMWLDTFAVLPLVVLGMVCLLRDRKFILYTVTLALSILMNYYIGFFTCIFILLAFICYQITCCKSIKRFFLDLGNIALFSVLAIGLTAILSLPTLAALGNTYSSVNTFPEGFSLNIVAYEQCTVAREAWEAFEAAKEAGEPAISLWFDALGKSFMPILSGMGQVAGNLTGGNVPSFKEGLPNIYCGVTTLILSFLFLMAKNIKLREKLCCIGLLVFFILSFIIRQLDYIWHGFHFTNMIPYRFSFLFSFVMLYMAYRAYMVRRRFKPFHLILAALLAVEVFLLSNLAAKVPDAWNALGEIVAQLGQVISHAVSGNQDACQSALTSLQSLYDTHGDVYVFLVYNSIFLLLTIVILLYPYLHKGPSDEATIQERKEIVALRKNRRNFSTALLCLVMVLELVMNVVNFGVNFTYTHIANYPQGTEYTESMIRYMKEREEGKNLFYRTEATHEQTLNDGALNEYYGISTFTSSANVKVTEFMCAMGFAAQNNWNRYCFEEGSPVSNLFLNLKYMLERQGKLEENPYFDSVHHYDNVYLLENNAYLPLGFLAESTLGEVELREGASHGFSNQNTMFTAATGIEDEVWFITPEEWLSITGEGVNITAQHAMGYCAYNLGNSSGTLTYTYEIEEDGFFCIEANMYARNSFHVYLNGEYLFSDTITLPQIYAISQVRRGDIIEIRASCAANENSSMTIRGALLREDIFRAGHEILNTSTLELTEFSTAKVAGNITCGRDGLLYTSIPEDGNWQAYVDGKRADRVLIAGAMIGVQLDEGEHEIEFRYENKAYTYGALISLFCLFVFFGLIYLQNRLWWNEKAISLYNKAKTLYKKVAKK